MNVKIEPLKSLKDRMESTCEADAEGSASKDGGVDIGSLRVRAGPEIVLRVGRMMPSRMRTPPLAGVSSLPPVGRIMVPPVGRTISCVVSDAGGD